MLKKNIKKCYIGKIFELLVACMVGVLWGNYSFIYNLILHMLKQNYNYTKGKA